MVGAGAALNDAVALSRCSTNVSSTSVPKAGRKGARELRIGALQVFVSSPLGGIQLLSCFARSVVTACVTGSSCFTIRAKRPCTARLRVMKAPY